MVARAGTLVPISRKCERLHTRCFPGFSQHRRCVIARGRRRARAPRPGGPRLRGRPPGAADSPPKAFSGQGKAPAGAGAFGSAFEVFQDVRQVRGVVAAELFEEVDFDVHWGFLSLFPLCRTSILSTATPPCQAPAVCPSPHFRALYGAVGYRTVRQRGPRLSYRNVTYPNGTYRRVTLPPSRLRLRTRNLLLRSSNLRLRR